MAPTAETTALVPKTRAAQTTGGATDDVESGGTKNEDGSEHSASRRNTLRTLGRIAVVGTLALAGIAAVAGGLHGGHLPTLASLGQAAVEEASLGGRWGSAYEAGASRTGGRIDNVVGDQNPVLEVRTVLDGEPVDIEGQTYRLEKGTQGMWSSANPFREAEVGGRCTR
jgi:hypothetical protein